MKGTNNLKHAIEIKTAVPMSYVNDIQGCTITSDALLTRRERAQNFVERGASYHITVKSNLSHLLDDLKVYLKSRSHEMYFVEHLELKRVASGTLQCEQLCRFSRCWLEVHN